MTNHLITIRDKDIFGTEETLSEDEYILRTAVKVIVFDGDDNIALVGTKYRLLPGGGVEEGETLEEAVVRECREEIGCEVVIESKVGTTDEYRTKESRHQITHCFVARVVGEKGAPTTTQQNEQGIQVEWLPLNRVHQLLEQEIMEISHESYNSCFNVRIHLRFLNEFIKVA